MRYVLAVLALCSALASAQQFSGGEVVTAQRTLKGDVFFALEFGGTAGGFGQFWYTPGATFHLQKSGGEGICPHGSFLQPGCAFDGLAGLPLIFNVDADCEVESFTVEGTLRVGDVITTGRRAVYSQQICNRNLGDEFSAGGSLTVHAE